MNQNEFTRLFQSALELAALRAEQRLNLRVPRHFAIRLAFPHESVQLLSLERAAEELFLAPDKFYLIIDVGIVEIKPHEAIVLVRPAPGAPGPFHETWNEPAGTGPFRQRDWPLKKTTEPPLEIPVELFRFNLAAQPS